MTQRAKTELAAALQPGRVEIGCDEAGRGCLAGPVVAAGVCLSEQVALDLVRRYELNDSKQLTKVKREALRKEVEERAEAWAVSFVSPEEIDTINILQASFLGMRRAAKALLLGGLQAEHLLIDGNRFRSETGLPPHTCLVKGDARFASIAAASVLAKTHRDNFMENLAQSHPGYGWETNAGYPTMAHRAAIARLGLTPHHRRSFQQLPNQPNLFSTT
jgi:ribonuclease HII